MYQGEFIGFLINNKLIFSVKTFHANFILPFNITTRKHSQIEKLDSSKIFVNHLVQIVIKFVLEMADFSISKNDGKLDLYDEL